MFVSSGGDVANAKYLIRVNLANLFFFFVSFFPHFFICLPSYLTIYFYLSQSKIARFSSVKHRNSLNIGTS